MVLNQKQLVSLTSPIPVNVTLSVALQGNDMDEVPEFASGLLAFIKSIQAAGDADEAGCIDGGNDPNPQLDEIKFTKLDPKNGGTGGNEPCPPDLPYKRALSQFGYEYSTDYAENDDEDGGDGSETNPPDIPSGRR